MKKEENARMVAHGPSHVLATQTLKGSGLSVGTGASL
jgi:hypothetical protein